jgi:hypothetical protein
LQEDAIKEDSTKKIPPGDKEARNKSLYYRKERSSGDDDADETSTRKRKATKDVVLTDLKLIAADLKIIIGR